MSFFDSAFAIVVGIEAGYVNDPKDPGGETRYGISKRAYPNVDIAQLTLDEAKLIYYRDYWNFCFCDRMPWERALCVFDMAVNQGPSAARALNIQAKDAIELMAQRALKYVETSGFDHYGHGWMRRLFTIFKAAQVTEGR